LEAAAQATTCAATACGRAQQQVATVPTTTAIV
jgi:hypothetical protein